MFSGGALERMSIFALGIIPYISASIITQLLVATTPSLQQLRKEGEAGRRKISQYTRYGTLVLATVQGLAFSSGLASQGLAYAGNFAFHFVAVTTLVTGTMFLMWLGEQVTERGIGNGISIIIFAGIVSGFPSAIGQSFEQARQGEISILGLLIIATLAIAVVAFVVYVERGQRRITINYARRQQGKRMYQAQTSHLPLKVNMAGVIPAIFASSLLLFPASLGQWFGQTPGMEWLQELSLQIAPGQPLNIILFSMGIVFFCFWYTAIMFNPKEVAENLKKSGAFIPGYRPGEQTAKYIDTILTRLTLFGSLYMTAVCLLPQILVVQFNVTFQLGGTALLIVVVVVMDFISQIQTHLMSNQYESLMKKSNLQNFGRR
jgi:preprotein translocase subunit SecY